jgi:hypothetical protein
MAYAEIKKKLDRTATEVKPKEFPGKTWGGKVGNTVIRTLKYWAEGLTEWLEERLINFAVGTMITFEQEYAKIAYKLVDKMLKMEKLPEEIKPMLEEIKSPKSPAGAAIASSLGMSALSGVATTALSTPLRTLSYELNKLMPNLLVSPEEAILAFRRGKVSPEVLSAILKSYGFNEERQEIKKHALKAVLGLADIKDLTLRGEIKLTDVDQRIMDLGFEEETAKELKILFNMIPTVDEAILGERRGELLHSEALKVAAAQGMTSTYYDLRYALTKELLDLGSIRLLMFRKDLKDTEVLPMIEKLGFDKETATKVLELFEYIPPIPDIIRFAVREAFTPEIIKKYELHGDFPPEFEKWAKKQGLSKEWALAYWASHWVLPSITMGYEMFHRGIITEADLEMLLRTQDVMPFWRDKLIKVAYSPYTRVDVRRMYQTGILNREDVKRSYLDLGYDEEKAENMTKFAISEGASTEKDLTKADILDGYTRTLFTEAETLGLLTDLGYDKIEAQFYILREDDKEYKKQKEKLLSLYEKQYKKNILDENEVIAALSAADFKASEIQYHINDWIIDKEIPTAIPSLADLKTFLKDKIITTEEFIKEMRGHKFKDEYIKWYYKSIMKKELVI